METKQALAVLLKLPKNHKLSGEEKDAVAAAVGAPDAAVLAESKLKGYIVAKKSRRQRAARV